MTHIDIEQTNSAELINIHHSQLGRELGHLAATTGAEVHPLLVGEDELNPRESRGLYLVPPLENQVAQDTGKNMGVRGKIHHAITGKLGGPYEVKEMKHEQSTKTADPARARVERSHIANDIKRQADERKKLQRNWSNSGF